MASPSFQREYCLKYGGHPGKPFLSLLYSQRYLRARGFHLLLQQVTSIVGRYVLSIQALDLRLAEFACASLSTIRLTQRPTLSLPYSDHGSYTGNVVQVLYAEEFERANFEAMIAVTVNLMKKYGIYSDPEGKVYVDGSASAFVRSLKIAIGEDPNYEGAIARAKTSGLKHPWWLGKVEPIMFGTGGAHKAMLGHAKMMMDKGFVAIHPSFTKLIIAIRTATRTRDLWIRNDLPIPMYLMP